MMSQTNAESTNDESSVIFLPGAELYGHFHLRSFPRFFRVWALNQTQNWDSKVSFSVLGRKYLVALGLNSQCFFRVWALNDTQHWGSKASFSLLGVNRGDRIFEPRFKPQSQGVTSFRAPI